MKCSTVFRLTNSTKELCTVASGIQECHIYGKHSVEQPINAFTSSNLGHMTDIPYAYMEVVQLVMQCVASECPT